MKKQFLTLAYIILSVALKAQCPSVTISPSTATIGCTFSGTANWTTFTAVVSPSSNVSYYWYNPGGSVGSQTLTYKTGNPGTYTFVAIDNTSSCQTTKTVAVTGTTFVPTMTINTPTGTKITCATPVLTLNITANAVVGPPKYVWTNPAAVSVTPATGGYSVNTPGTYTATFTDGNNCTIAQQVIVAIDTLKPSPFAISSLTGNSFTLDCVNSTLTSTAVTNPMLPIASYSWVQPSPALVMATNTLQISTASVTTNPTTFTVLAVGANSCVGKAQVFFYKNTPAIPISVSNTPTIICAGQQATLTASGAINYTWSTGSTSASIIVTPTANTNYSVVGSGTTACNGTGSITQSVSACTRIESLNNLKNGFNIFPVPAREVLIIETNNFQPAYTIRIFSSIGTQVLLHSLEAGKTEIPVVYLTAGIYYYQIEDKNGVTVRGKFLKE